MANNDPLGLRSSIRLQSPRQMLNARPRKQTQQQQDPTQDPSFVHGILNAGLSGLGAVANVLDLPGSMVRDTLGGENPFDQLLSPLHDDNRISGRDLNRRYGLAGQDNNWHNFFGGLATEVLTDPLTLTGYKALGSTAKGAELLKTGTQTAKTLGGGIRAGERALAAGKVPFGPHWAVGTGETAAKVGDALDKAFSTVRYSKPGLLGAAMFSAPAKGNLTRAGQEAGADLFQMEQQIKRYAKKKQLDTGVALHEAGTTDPVKLRSAFEGVSNAYPELDPGITSGVRQTLDDLLRVNRSVGRPSRKLEDAYIQGFPRYRKVEPNLSLGGRSGPQMSAKGSKDLGRKVLLKDWKRGTAAVNEFVKDPAISGFVESYRGSDSAGRKAVLAMLTKHIKQNWGHEFDPLKVVRKGKEVEIDRAPHLAKYMLRSKEAVRSKGMYGNHPLVDYHTKILHDLTKAANVQAVHNAVFDYLPDELKALSSGVKPTTLDDLLKLGEPTFDPTQLKQMKLNRVVRETPQDAVPFSRIYGKKNGIGLDPRQAAATLLHQHGIQTTSENLSKVLDTLIPADVAKDLLRGYEKRTGPEAEGMLKKVLHGYTNLFKAGVLSFPSRIFRDYVSNIGQDLLHGTANLKNYAEAHRVYLGGKLKDLPDVAMEYAEHGPGDIFKHTDVAGSHVMADSPELSHILGTIPGAQKSTTMGNVKDVFDTLFRGKDGATWNPMKAKVRGVNQAAETTFAPFKAAEMAGHYTDTMGRLAPYINLRRKGWSPEEAMKRVNDLKVNYDPSTFTETEKWLKGVFPFYSFVTRSGKHVAKELTTNPGGGLANAVRVQNKGRDKDTALPEFIKDTAAIPLGTTEDGTKRYLASLGLMHEAPLEFFNPGPDMAQSFGRKAIASSNPLLKGPLEHFFGQSSFQPGDDGGGRPLGDLDPTIGRILANVTGAQDPITFPGSQALDQILMNSPVARVLTTARTLTDPRKSVNVGGVQLPGPAALANVLTGFRVSDVSPATQEKALRSAVQKAVKGLGGKTFSEVYLPKSREERLSEGSKEDLGKYRAALNSLAKKARSRKPKSSKTSRRKKSAGIKLGQRRSKKRVVSV